MAKSTFAKLAILVCLVVSAGCATMPDEGAVQTSETEAIGPAPTQFVKGLPPQTLEPNECGLFLWSKSDISNFVFFAKAGELTAIAHIEGDTTDLEIVSRRGDVFGQFFTEYEFSTPAGETVSLSYEPGRDLTDGARVRAGVLQYDNSEGWRKVVPILGARVCQPVVAPLGAVSIRDAAR